MTKFKDIRRLACLAAVAIAGLALPAPAHAQIIVTITDSATSDSVVLTDFSTPGVVSLSLTQVGDIFISSFSVNANYNGATDAIPAPGTTPAYVTDTTLQSQNMGSSSDTLTILVSAGTYTVPGGPFLSLVSGETSSSMSASNDSATLASTLTSGSNTFGTLPITLTGPFSGASQGAISSPSKVGPSTGSFSLSNTLTLNYGASGNAIQIGANTDVTGVVPEPSTWVLALSGGLLMSAFGWTRNWRRREE